MDKISQRKIHVQLFGHSKVMFTPVWMRIISDEDASAQYYVCFLGLYGLLKPLDLMQPYRFEWALKLANPKGKIFMLLGTLSSIRTTST